MNVSLVLVRPDGSSKEFELGSLPVELGRGETCRVHVPLPSVSRKHCRLERDDDDELVVTDLKSSNGTFVNGKRVHRHELVPGDVLAVGDVTFVVRIDGHPRSIDAREALATSAPSPDADPGVSARVPGAGGGGAVSGGGAGATGRAGGAMPMGDDLLAGLSDDESDDSDFDLDVMGGSSR